MIQLHERIIVCPRNYAFQDYLIFLEMSHDIIVSEKKYTNLYIIPVKFEKYICIHIYIHI